MAGILDLNSNNIKSNNMNNENNVEKEVTSRDENIPDSKSLHFPENFTIANCKEQYALVTEKLDNNEEFAINLSAVKQVDTAALQFLYSLLQHKNVSCNNISNELENYANMLDLELSISA